MHMITKILENIKNQTKLMFLEHKEHPPIFFLETDEGIGLMPAAEMFGDANGKDKCVEILKHLISIGKVKGFIFIAEAWVKTVDSFAEMREHYKKFGGLKFAKDKKEILMIQYQSFDSNFFYVADIVRNGDEVSLGDWVEHKNEGKNPISGGRFDNLFEKAKAASN